MKNENKVLFVAAVVGAVFMSCGAFAKTAKDCVAEWRADKAGMQSRGVTEKAYVEQCKGGDAAPAASAPAPKPVTAAPPVAPRQTESSSGKTAKDCIAEWRADKAGMQARGVTQKSYVEQCRAGGAAPTAAAPAPAPAPVQRPTAASPAAAPPPPSSSSSQKTAKDCIAEWRADKAGMQARGVTEKSYVESCRAGGAAPTAAAPEPKPAVAPAPPARQASPAVTPAAPAAPAPRPAPTTTAAPVAPAQPPAANNSGPTLEAGQFADDASAKARCPADTVVWVNLPSKVYHFAGTRSYGTTKRGAYMCEKEAIAAEDRAAKTEKHP